jgi:H+/Cl- antiporter ClcA
MTDPQAPKSAADEAAAAARRWSWLSSGRWRQRLVYWSGAVLVGMAAVAFAALCERALWLFELVRARYPLLPLLVTPLIFATLAWLTQGRLSATRGSGIPQVKAALASPDEAWRRSLLSVPMALAKMLLTVFAIGAGASVGREGPTVHVGAGLLYGLGRRFGLTDPRVGRHLVLAGAAAGIAAAFNTPLAGVVFAIEEMAGAFEEPMSGVLLTAVILAGITAIGVLGDYAYFGRVEATLPLGRAWLAVLVTGIVGGLAGGLFARLILWQPVLWLRRFDFARHRAGVLVALACGLALVLLCLVSGHDLYGSGYAQARAIVQQQVGQGAGGTYGVLKFFANVVSYWSGVPGGIFSPSLAVGAGLGQGLAPWLAGAPPASVVLLAMAAYLAGVTQAPLTAAVIALELTANRSLVIPVMAVCLLARSASGLVCRTPVYAAFAERLLAQQRAGQAKTDPP